MVSPRRVERCKSSALSHAHTEAMNTQHRYSAQKNLDAPLSTPSHEQLSATSAGSSVHEDERGGRILRRCAASST